MDTDTSLLLATVRKFVDLDSTEEAQLKSLLQARAFKKGQFLLYQGTSKANTYFVNRGSLKTYLVDQSGIEHILSFSPKGWWAGDLRAFYQAEPSQLNIEAIIDSEVLILSQEDREGLYAYSAKFERFFRILAERAFINLQDRVLESLTLTAMERYQKFVRRYPDALHVLPQKQIAAFIGVTPEFLSRAKSHHF